MASIVMVYARMAYIVMAYHKPLGACVPTHHIPLSQFPAVSVSVRERVRMSMRACVCAGVHPQNETRVRMHAHVSTALGSYRLAAFRFRAPHQGPKTLG